LEYFDLSYLDPRWEKKKYPLNKEILLVYIFLLSPNAAALISAADQSPSTGGHPIGWGQEDKKNGLEHDGQPALLAQDCSGQSG
jgi:hypothetical protein